MLGPRAGIGEQGEIESRRDVLVYSTQVLERDTEVTGPIRTVLFVQSSALHTDFTVKLVDVHPDAKAYNVSDGILRRAYEPNPPGSPVEIKIDLWPTSMLFRQGHAMRIEVSSSNFPRYGRNRNTGREMTIPQPFLRESSCRSFRDDR